MFSFTGIKRFLGNHTHTDYFKLLRKDGNSLLIGARNIVYNLTLPSLQENIDQVRFFSAEFFFLGESIMHFVYTEDIKVA